MKKIPSSHQVFLNCSKWKKPLVATRRFYIIKNGKLLVVASLFNITQNGKKLGGY
jgi:hypothetical protein